MKKILILTAVLAMIALSLSCTQKTHFRFEKIRNAYFRENTKFFAMHNLLWVIDRDKLVCADPENGEMKEYVDLPGHVLDARLFGSSLSMIFGTSKGFIFVKYSLNVEKPNIKAGELFGVEGSRFLSLNDDPMILYDVQSRALTGYKDGKLTGKHVFGSNCHVGMAYEYDYPEGNEPIISVYDGKILAFAGIGKNGKIEYPLADMPKIALVAKDFDKALVVGNKSDSICVYDGESFNFVVTNDNYKTHKINTVPFPGLNSVESDSLNIYASSSKGLFIIDYVEPTRISDSRFDLIESMKLNAKDDGKPSTKAYLLGMQLGEGYKVGLIKTVEPINMARGKTEKPDILTFDTLPKGAACVNLAKINDRHFVYAFTSEGLFRSEPID